MKGVKALKKRSELRFLREDKAKRTAVVTAEEYVAMASVHLFDASTFGMVKHFSVEPTRVRATKMIDDLVGG